MYILRHIVEVEKTRGNSVFQVKSAFARKMSPGYIYVEAPMIRDVIPACEGFVGYQGRFRDATLVSLNDSIALLNHQPPDLGLRVGSWVRIRRGHHADDLAYLYRLEAHSNKESLRTRGLARVKVVPRIDKAAQDLEKHLKPDERPLKRKRAAARPPQQFFESWYWKKAVQLEGDKWKFQGDVYENGLMDLHVPINLLNIGITTPSHSELLLWMTCPDESLRQFAEHSHKLLGEEFWVNDRVKVISGDQLGRRGIVQAVNGSELSVLLWAEGLSNGHTVASISIAITSSACRKVFEVGDYVMGVATSDQDQEESGFVVAVDVMHDVGQHHKITLVKHGSYEEVGIFLASRTLILIIIIVQFSRSSTTLHLRDHISRLLSGPTRPGQTLNEENLFFRVKPPSRDTTARRFHRQHLFKGMPVIVTHKHAKGLLGDIRSAHDVYWTEEDGAAWTTRDKRAKTVAFDQPNGAPPQHKCISGCPSCYIPRSEGHICSATCKRCHFDRLPDYKKEDGGTGVLKGINVDLYIPAQSRVITVGIQHVRPAEYAFIRRCKNTFINEYSQ